MVGKRFASMVLPAPGGPIKIALCPPAAAISNARFIFSWPFTSQKSISKSLCALCKFFACIYNGWLNRIFINKKINHFINVANAIHF